MSSNYDPRNGPDPKEWLSLDEGIRIILVEEYHQEAGVKLPNLRLHAIIHVVLENQAAMGDETPVQKTLARLIEEGLNRHDALHAIGSVLSKQLYNLLSEKPKSGFGDTTYQRDLERLTAMSWRRGDWTK